MATTWLPGASVVDLHGSRGNGPFTKFLGVVLHVNVDEAGTPDSFWVNNPGQVTPNFQVYKDGSVHQLLPFNWQPWCQVDGNFNYAAIETAGLPTEPLTDAQCVSIARILAVYHAEHGMALTVADSPGQAGFGVHSMGGTAWGGHSCPGDIRANQRAHILTLAAGSTEDDMTPAESAMLTDLHQRLGAFDLLSYAVQNQVTPAVAAIRVQTLAIGGKLDALAAGGDVDVTTLAGDLATALGPQLGQQLVTALSNALTGKAAS